ncbi:MAG: 4Fe-4S binding protein [Thermodesulfobacteriota bacterium]
MLRRWVQAASALLQNAYLAFPWTGTLYQGRLKYLCTPGLNCYSCPAAVLSCPLGALQHFVGAVRPAVRWGTYRLGFYVAGFLIAVGLLSGRFPCGWLCPFGLLQDGLHRVPSAKIPVPRWMGALRYAALGILVLFLPLALTSSLGYGEAWFCRLVCPAGTLEAAGLFWIMPALREQVGPLFAWKLVLLAAVLTWAVASYRPYCRTLCPLGAIYGLFNRWSLVGVEWDPALCRDCRACAEGCELEVDPRRHGRSAACLRCFGCARERCPTGALSVRVGTRRFRPAPCDLPSTPAS